MSRDYGCLSNGWFMDGSDSELLPNKKQALDNPSRYSFAGVAPSNFPFWEHMSSFNSIPAQLNERSLDAQSILFGGGNVSPLDTGHLSPGRDNISLSVSHSPKNSIFGIDYRGIRKVKASQVRDSDNFLPLSTGPSHTREVGVGTTAHSFSEMDISSIIYFDGNHNDAGTSGRMICDYDFPVGQISGQRLDTFATDANPVIGTAQGSSHGSESASERIEDRKPLKKVPLNNFPSNVRSLLSTGILDEVPVKYSAWSREVLHGIIKGAGYLCGCQSCNFSNVINAYEFERHAGCKTKHPNNHIYFDNGKTVYGVVQELRSTPQNMLFDTIQTITGSPVNQKSFRLWKESFLAATRELQRIYSKDGRKGVGLVV